MHAPLPVGWSLFHMILDESPEVLKTMNVFTVLYDILRHPNAISKEEACLALVQLLRLPPSKNDPRQVPVI